MFCHKCGNKMPEGSEFCNKCGTKTVITETDATVTEEISSPNIPSDPTKITTEGRVPSWSEMFGSIALCVLLPFNLLSGFEYPILVTAFIISTIIGLIGLITRLIKKLNNLGRKHP